MKKKTNEILHGSALERLKELETESVDCIVTSSPYWALRDYKVDGQIGVEKTIDEYVTNLINVFDECKRVLKKSGTCWIVLGDTYSGNVKAGNKVFGNPEFNKNRPSRAMTLTPEKNTGLQDKTLCMIPERFSIKMIDSGWILRNKIIWHKRNCMPSSAKDRFTVDYEYVYFFTKSQKYYFKTQYEKSLSYGTRTRWAGDIFRMDKNSKYKDANELSIRPREGRNMYPNGEQRIKRCVWSINTTPLKEAHFAVFPEELVRQCLDAGCPSEICTKCGKTKFIEYTRPKAPTVEIRDKRYDRDSSRKIGGVYQNWLQENPPQQEIISCHCNLGFESGIVLDPFIGSGTTALVALKNNRRFIGIELNEDYIKIALKRIEPYLYQSKLVGYEL
jgi:DNA modification methylase